MSWLLCTVVLWSGQNSATVLADKDGPVSVNTPQAVARVGKETIYETDVALELATISTRGKIADDERGFARRAMIEQLVKRQLVLQRLATENLVATDREVDAAYKRLVRQFEERGEPFVNFLNERKTDGAALRRQIKWQRTWQRALEKYLTSEQIRKHFDRHRREFDGTELRVAHILWKVPKDAPEATWQDLEASAREIKTEIEKGIISFSEAARKHSQAPTSDEGGDIGFIQRQGPMPEVFTKTAFDLKVGRVSEPVRSTSGVHLIQFVEEKAGQKQLDDVRSEVQRAATIYLFNWFAERQRAKTVTEILWREQGP